MLEPLQAILPDIRAVLGIPVYTQASKLNRDDPDPPYALALPVSRPANPTNYEEVLVFGLNVWGPLWKVSELANDLDNLLEGERKSEYEGLRCIRYKMQSTDMNQEPEVPMPDGVTELWNLSMTWRARFVRLSSVGVKMV